MTSYSLFVTSRGGFPLRPSSNGHVLMPVKMHRQGLTPLVYFTPTILGLWLRLECSLDSLSIDSAHVIYVSEGYDVAYNRRTASQPSHVVLRVTWYVKTFRNVNYVC